DFARGRELARIARCAACHTVAGEASHLSAPALDQLAGNVNSDWLRWWLDTSIKKPAELGNRAQHVPLQQIDAQAAAQLTAWLLDADEAPMDQPLAGEVAKGQRLFETLGCLACHRVGERGTATTYSGSDLTTIADKRPADFFARWLESPEKLNRDHRMPTFELSPPERGDLAAYLATLTSKTPPAPAQVKLSADAKQQGQRLAAQLGCANCHHLPGDVKRLPRTAWRVEAVAKWSCQQAADGEQTLLRYDHTPQQRADLAAFVSAVAPLRQRVKKPLDGAQLLVERNCVGCHSRETSAGLAPQLLKLAQQQPDYSALVPALTPPSLLAVGDKLHDEVLLKVMQRLERPHRDYLHVRMPRFDWEQEELDALVRHFVSYDRIPDDAPDPRRQPKLLPPVEELVKAGERLVTPAGFGCTSCHAIGNVPPVKATLNARGPNLSLIGQRTREPWFYRWCQNPARMVPQMEMPSVQVPVKGVLNDNIDQQLAAVWTILNKPGFEPKDIGPLRIVRRSGDLQLKEPPTVGTDVLIAGGKTYLAPLVVALPNRHNLLFDLESGRLARWWLGDAMEQRTKGKSWYWQTDGIDLLESGFESPEITLVRAGSDPAPQGVGQFITELDDLLVQEESVLLGYRLQYDDIAPSPGPRTLRVFQSFHLLKDEAEWSHGWQRVVVMRGLPKDSVARLRVVGSERMRTAELSKDGRTLKLAGDHAVTISLPDGVAGRIDADGSLVSSPSLGEESATPVMLSLVYRTAQTPEKSQAVARATSFTERAKLAVIPGLSSRRLAIDSSLMPTGLAWQPSAKPPAQGEARMVVASLEGRIWSVEDTNGDGIEDHARAISDDLAAPYGIVARQDAIDVVTKTGLLRLNDGRNPTIKLVARWTRLASGWGHTDDYHDWTVGIVPASNRRYYLALPCVQDRRSPEAARYRGEVLHVDFSAPVDRHGESLKVSTSEIKSVSSGHR
ncbi:MAG TPA: c-type cytochrome, partial [Pirellulaceae bacterium]|nr:c-type cytochrome [Pirellulaceae bacterium]